MESVERYLKDMKFKRRVFGGVDEESALLHIQKICELYKAELKEMQALREATAEAQSALKAAQEEAEQQKVAYANLQVEAAKARQQCDEWKKAAEHGGTQEAERLKREYAQKYRELTEAVDTIQTVKKEAAVRAQVEAAQEAAKLRNEIMAKVEEERKSAEKEVQRLRSEAETMRRQKQEIRQEIEASRKEWQLAIDKLMDELQAMREKAEPTVKTIPKPLSGMMGDGRHAG